MPMLEPVNMVELAKKSLGLQEAPAPSVTGRGEVHDAGCDGNPAPGAETVEELRAEYEQARAVYEQARDEAAPYRKAEDFAQEAMKRLELDLMRAEGRGHLLHAAWLEAWLEGRHEDCAAIIRSEEWKREVVSGVLP